MVRTAYLAGSSLLVPEVLASALGQLGYAVLPPRHPEGVQAVLAQAGQLPEAQSLYDDADLESWQPCIVSLRLTPARGEVPLAETADRREHGRANRSLAVRRG